MMQASNACCEPDMETGLCSAQARFPDDQPLGMDPDTFY